MDPQTYISRAHPEGEERICFQRLSLGEALARIPSNRISLGSVMHHIKYYDCRYPEDPRADCICYSHTTDGPRMLGGSIVINALTGETLDTRTPILSSIDRFIRGVYRVSHRSTDRRRARSDARWDLVNALEEGE